MHKNTSNDPTKVVRDMIVDFPAKEELGVYWSERLQLDLSAPYFGWGPDP